MADVIALKISEVAQSCRLSEKTIWAHTVPRGDLVCIRVGRSVRYRPSDVDEWLEARRELVED